MSRTDQTHDPKRSSWVDSASGHPDFPVQNLPLGIFSHAAGAPRPGVAIGDSIVDLAALAGAGLLDGIPAAPLSATTLNALFELPAATRRARRARLSAMLYHPPPPPPIGPPLHPANHTRHH